jgi:hypothetical protein
VRVVLPGYEAINRRVTLTPENAARELTFDLQPTGRRAAAPPVSGAARTDTAPPAGTPAPTANASLSISSRPTGARIFLDGRLIGTAPTKMTGLKPGSYHVRVELEGYRTWTTTVRVGAGQDARVAAPLVPQ